jgi:hypothetical protein
MGPLRESTKVFRNWMKISRLVELFSLIIFV